MNKKLIDENKDIIRTMEYIGQDDFGYPTYKCIEIGILYKDANSGNGPINLYSCGNDFYEGELCHPINKDWEIHFKKKYTSIDKQDKFNYMMLSRLKMDCDYYLGNGNHYAPHLWALEEQKQIDEMKKIYKSFSDDKKPEWLTWEQILEYERLMLTEDISKNKE